MSLPIYENIQGVNNFEIRPFAGMDILSQMKRYKKQIPTIIVTQFEIFSLSKDKKDEVSIVELIKHLKKLEYSNYRGLVYYDVTSDSWEKELIDLMV